MQFSELHKVTQEKFEQRYRNAEVIPHYNSLLDMFKSFSTQTFLQIAEGEKLRAERQKVTCSEPNCDGGLDCEHFGWNAAKDQDIAYWEEQIKLMEKK